MLSRVIIFATMMLVSTFQFASAETAETTWTDLSYLPCEGVGLAASRRVLARMTFERATNEVRVMSFSLSTIHPILSDFSATIDFTNSNGSDEQIRLVSPWYPQIAEQGLLQRVLPRNKTASRPGPEEQMELAMAPSTPIKISASFVFGLDGGSCAGSFETEWSPF